VWQSNPWSVVQLNTTDLLFKKRYFYFSHKTTLAARDRAGLSKQISAAKSIKTKRREKILKTFKVSL
jgi:hypothetical protein